MKLEASGGKNGMEPGGLAGWLLDKLRRGARPRPRLALRERIALAPRQSLALVEADGRRLLVATSPEGAPAFYALDSPSRRARDEKSIEPLRSTFQIARRSTQRTASARRSRAAW
jgi:flagellar biogenesis protein FliO